MLAKRKLLFLSQTYPFPPTGGVSLRTFNIIKELSEAYEITLLSFDRKRTPATSMVPESDLQAMRNFAQTHVFKIPQQLSSYRMLLDHLRSVLHRRVFTVFRLTSSAFTVELQRQLSEWKPDLIHVDSLDLSSVLPLLPLERVTVTHHNVESELLERRAGVEQNQLRRAYFVLQGKLQKAEERQWCPEVALNVTVSDRDSSELARRAGAGQYLTVPNGVDTEFFSPGDGCVSEQKGVVFVGGTTWFPNRDALEYFSSDILPRIRAIRSDVPVKWIGRATTAEVESFGRLGIEMTGFVDDIRPHVRRAACFGLPFRVGGGTRLKLLDAWSLGKAVVSTSQGAEGVRAIDGGNILIRDDPEEFARAVAEVVSNVELRARLGREARATACEHYCWGRIGRGLRAAYAEL